MSLFDDFEVEPNDYNNINCSKVSSPKVTRANDKKIVIDVEGRSKHLLWAKERAYREGVASLMWSSFVSDMGKHDDLRDHGAISLGNKLGMSLLSIGEVKKFIEGFN